MRRVFAINEEHMRRRDCTAYNSYTCGYKIRIDEENGQSYFYLVSNQGYRLVKEIEALDMTGANELFWDELELAVKDKHIRRLYPNATEQEYNIEVYGEEEGRRINEKNEWADAHMVFSREITLKLREELGEFTKVSHLSFRFTSLYVRHKYLIDGKWVVTITFDDQTKDVIGNYTIEVLAQYEKNQFYKRVALLSRTAGIPWPVAYTVSHYENNDVALELIEQVIASRKNVTEEIRNDFFHGIIDSSAVIEKVLDKHLKNKLNLPGWKQKEGLANFLVSQ